MTTEQDSGANDWYKSEDDKAFLEGANKAAEGLFQLGDLTQGMLGGTIKRLSKLLADARATPGGADFLEKVMAENRGHVAKAEQRRSEVATEARIRKELEARVTALEVENENLRKSATAGDCGSALRESLAEVKRVVDGGEVNLENVSRMLEAALEANPCLGSERVTFSTRAYGPAKMKLREIIATASQRRSDEMWWTDELVHDLSVHLCQELAQDQASLEDTVKDYLNGVAREAELLHVGVEIKLDSKGSGYTCSAVSRRGREEGRQRSSIREAMLSLNQETTGVTW